MLGHDEDYPFAQRIADLRVVLALCNGRSTQLKEMPWSLHPPENSIQEG